MLSGLHFWVSLLGGGLCLSGCNSRLILSDNLWQVIALEGKAGGLLIANYSGFYVGGQSWPLSDLRRNLCAGW